MKLPTVTVRIEVECVPKGHYCPCNWVCHPGDSPCSLSCGAHHSAWQAVQPPHAKADA